MALESGTYVSDLVSSNPPGTDGKSQGDDHLRLIKSTLGATFPNASRAFYFADVPAAKTTTYTILASDENALLRCDASAGAFTITMPVGSSVFAGWKVSIAKSDSGANAVTVDGSTAETINGAADRTFSDQYQLETYMWDGAEWKIVGDSPPTVVFPATTIMLFQQTSAPTGWTKLTTHDDKALRVVSGTPSSGGATAFGTVFGSGKATSSHTLSTSEIPAHTHDYNKVVTNITTGAIGDAGFGADQPITAASSSTGGGSGHVHNLSLDLQYVDIILAQKD